MNEWWASIDTFERLFWYLAIPFSIILIIQMILTFVGMGGSDSDVGGGETDISGLDLETDIDIDADMIDVSDAMDSSDAPFDLDPSFHFFTIRNFIAFFTLFGWAGIAAWNEGMSKTWTILIATAAGLLAMIIITALFYFISKMQDSGGALRIRYALNQIGNVYIPIKAKAGNVGKVQIALQDSMREMQAITRGDEDLNTGAVVKVVGIVSNSILVVEKIDK
ncbi:MAG: hypothetical protein K8R53_15375 [Bacteroidales bacterium]|nr:hypothetical protein [Bacteroidales bacterium]